ncbi:peptide-methionine (R)-S-oxide reductase MsrB [Geobacter sp. OR-1]|uniref:peptide-methionine (R)-S-oxide reductase MsrB n=1 Tax=Geobacter sp. OR-1 TaxID=1266765 RepID=UPI0005A7EFFE
MFACRPSTGGSEKGGALSLKIYSAELGRYIMSQKVIKTEQEWKRILTKEQFHILREKGTERAFTGKLLKVHEHGVFRCAGCGLDLFNSEDKFESGTGWPSFTKPIAPENITTRPDNSLFSKRTEVLCSRCEGHLGHVFDDGPKPTGLRYCMNSEAMLFVELKGQ